MAEIVNLRMARKRAVRRDEEAKANANRTAFGVPKASRQIASKEQERADRALDGKKRRGPDRDRGAPKDDALGKADAASTEAT